jgi:hypothetical protein
MIPELDDNGYLPPGIHPASLDEIAARFGQETEIRRVQMESLRWLADVAKRAGVKRLVLDGRFVTDWPEPNDVDCVLLLDLDFPADPKAVEELREGYPFLDLQLVDQEEFDWYTGSLFAKDREQIPRGLVEVVL